MASLCKNLRLARHGASYISHRLGAMRTFSSNSPILITRPQLQVKSDQPSSARILAPRAFHNVAQQTGVVEPEHVKEMNKAPPAHYLVQVDSFSRLDKLGVDKYEIGVFEAGGYKWSLSIYPIPHGDEETTKVPVKLALVGSSASSETCEFDAVFSICLKNQAGGFFRSVLGRQHFDATKTEFIGHFPKHFLTDPAFGYLKDDACVFGAEVFVNRNEVVTENMSLKNLKPPPYKREFKIPNFPTLNESGGWVSHQTWTSEVFSFGGHDWKLKVFPNGWEEGVGRLSVFLENIVDLNDYDDYDRSVVYEYVEASFTVTLKSQYDDDDNVKQRSGTRFSTTVGENKGWRTFIDLASLNDPDRGFIVDDCVYLELELSVGRD